MPDIFGRSSEDYKYVKALVEDNPFRHFPWQKYIRIQQHVLEEEV